MRAKKLQELEKLAAKLSATARTLPPGEDRQNAYREIARFRDRIADLINSKANHGDSSMRRQICLAILIAVSTLTVVAPTPAPAEAIQDRYCLQGRQWGYPGNCQFSNYQQCMATASGTDAYCGINPRYAFARQWRGPQQYRW
jgi:hypothetical protein